MSHARFLSRWPHESTPTNFGTGLGPFDQAVRENRQRLAHTIGRRCLWANQVHGTDAVVWTAGQSVPEQPSTGDIIFVDARDAHPGEAPAACVVTADCLPVLMRAEDGSCWAAVHAGRRGIDRGVIPRTIGLFRERGVRPAQLIADIGPAICGDCYEVDLGLWNEWKSRGAAHTSWGTPSLDLFAAAQQQLEEQSVQQVVLSHICTREDPEWHSYRRSPVCGRQVGYVYM